MLVFFGSSLQKSKDFTEQELIESIPSGSVTIYFNQEHAERALREKRNMIMVEDPNPHNVKGFTYRSKQTPCILQVQLKEDLESRPYELNRKISKALLDFEKPVNVINCEKGYKGHMPSSFSIENFSDCRSKSYFSSFK